MCRTQTGQMDMEQILQLCLDTPSPLPGGRVRCGVHSVSHSVKYTQLCTQQKAHLPTFPTPPWGTLPLPWELSLPAPWPGGTWGSEQDTGLETQGFGTEALRAQQALL